MLASGLLCLALSVFSFLANNRKRKQRTLLVVVSQLTLHASQSQPVHLTPSEGFVLFYVLLSAVFLLKYTVKQVKAKRVQERQRYLAELTTKIQGQIDVIQKHAEAKINTLAHDVEKQINKQTDDSLAKIKTLAKDVEKDINK